MLCETCPKRDTCTELCAAAKKYVNQDYVEVSSLVISVDPNVIDYIKGDLEYNESVINELNDGDWELLRKYMFNLTILQELCFYKYFFGHLKQWQIAELIGQTKQSVSQHIDLAKRKILVNLNYR
jgi:DNA-directed RNA polymerase specialized sigma24 family protein